MADNTWAVIKRRANSPSNVWWMVERKLSEGQARNMMSYLNMEPAGNNPPRAPKWIYNVIDLGV